jgi:hypothetical protein
MACAFAGAAAAELITGNLFFLLQACCTCCIIIVFLGKQLQIQQPVMNRLLIICQNVMACSNTFKAGIRATIIASTRAYTSYEGMHMYVGEPVSV